jgi:hypothetical protein
MISDTTYSDPSDKGIVSKYRRQSNRWCDNVLKQNDDMSCKRDYGEDTIVRINPAKVKVNNTRFCQCPGSEPGKIKIDTSAHESGCWLRKKLLSGRYAMNTSVIPPKIDDGYSLGVALTD